MKEKDKTIGRFAYLSEELQQLTNAITKSVSAEKVICFGSVIHQIKRKSCFGDVAQSVQQLRNQYNLLVIPASEEVLAPSVILQRIDSATVAIATVNAMVYPMEEVNAALQNGSSFFTGIYKKGTLLYDRNEVPFAEPGAGAPISARIIKREKFWDKWFALSQGFMEGASFYKQSGRHNLAVFMLHQSLQHCYAGLLRVYTGYRANSNSLNRLLRLIDSILPDSEFVLAQHTPEDARLNGLLLKGFSDARYKDSFEVSEQEVAILLDRVNYIVGIADQRCRKRIEKLKDGKVVYV